jgi:tetratricopeptide (TPR) repeat protein
MAIGLAELYASLHDGGPPFPQSCCPADEIPGSLMANVMGNIARHRGKPITAWSFYHKALLTNPCSPEFFSNRAAVYYDNGDLDFSIQDCQSALAIDPSFVPAIIRLALAHWTARHTAAAIKELEKGLELCPAHPLLLHNLAFLSQPHVRPPPFPTSVCTLPSPVLLQPDPESLARFVAGDC